MRYAKLVNGYPEFAPRRILWEDMQVFNPAPEKLLALGYKPVTCNEPWGEPPEGCFWAEAWSETGEAIVQLWQAAALPDEDEEEGT